MEIRQYLQNYRHIFYTHICQITIDDCVNNKLDLQGTGTKYYRSSSSIGQA